MGKMFMLFTGITVVCILAYITLWALIMSNPENSLGFSFIMMPLGWGILVGIVGAVVCYIMKK